MRALIPYFAAIVIACVLIWATWKSRQLHSMDAQTYRKKEELEYQMHRVRKRSKQKWRTT